MTCLSAGSQRACAGLIGLTQVVIVSGEAAPDGDGVFDAFAGTALNDAGQVAFRGTLTGTSNTGGVFRRDGASGPIVQMIRTGQLSPDGNGTYATANPPALNAAGVITTTLPNVNDTIGGNDDDLIWIVTDGVTQTMVTRRGAAAPGGNGMILTPSSTSTINASGQLAATSSLSNTSGGTSDNTVLLFHDGSNLVEAARRGEPAPDLNGVLNGMSAPSLNDAGQLAYAAQYQGTSGGTTDNTAVVRLEGGVPTTIARGGQASPDGNGVISSISTSIPLLNELGQVGFFANLTGTSGGSLDNGIILLGDGSNIDVIARKGQALPGGLETINNFISTPVTMNNAGQIAIRIGIDGSPGGVLDDLAVLRTDGIVLELIAREGMPAPEGNGVIEAFGGLVINDAGQTLMLLSYRDTLGGAADDLGIAFYDDVLGLLEVAREGDAFLGSTITGLTFAQSALGSVRTGFNETGVARVAYEFDLADGREGIAIWTVPEPSTWAMFGLGAIGAGGLSWRSKRAKKRRPSRQRS